MSLLQLSLAYLKRRPWGTLLNVVLLALGLATIVVLLLFSHQVERNLTANAEGIDLVVGAKGSPLQLILSSVYHVDSPTGNIPVSEAERLTQSPMIGTAIPLALGDSYRGFRVVGSTDAYLAHYGAEVGEGARWSDVGEVVLGAQVAEATGLALGDEIVSAHGLGQGGAAHDEVPLRVVGTLAPSGTVLDRLILTSVETVWAVHGDVGSGGAHDEEHADDHDDADHDDAAPTPLPPAPAPPPSEAGALPARDGDAHANTARGPTPPAMPPGAAPGSPVAGMPMPGMAPGGGGPSGAPGAERQYTAVLLTFASPLAAVTFPRMVNAQTNLQAAAPAIETQRLLNLLGIGLDALRLFGIVLIAAAALGVGIALYNALRERRYDLAVMRSLGASRGKLVAHVLLEGLLLAALGAVLGLALGHLAAGALGAATAGTRTPVPLSGLTFVPGELALVAIVLGLGALAALVPAVQAYRTDIARLLAKG